MSILIDQFELLGIVQRSVSPTKLIGAVLLLIAVILIQSDRTQSSRQV